MPSPRFQQLRRTSIEAAGLLGLACLIACSSAPPPVAVPTRPEPAEPRLAKSERPYLVDPSTGYAPEASTADVSHRGELTAGYHRLFDEGEPAAAREAADAVLAADPGFPPALVLAAQADFAADRWAEVVARLVPVLDKLPTYVAGQLVLGRAAERLGDLPLAYSAYRAIAAKSPLAFSRTGELHPRALEIVLHRLEEQVRGQQLDEADKNLALLRAWAPAEEATFAAARSLAVARGDQKAELSALKSLSRFHPGDRELLERRADLEFEVGDPGAGLQLVQRLAEQYPKDPEITARLASAKFRWRFTLLPQVVRTSAAKPELNRADFAVLLYWLVADVRYAKPGAGRIATDVLDLPQQEEIVRVVNLGLMDVDTTLHRFSPGATLRRGTALRSLQRLVRRFGRQVSCLQPAPGESDDACQFAVRCALVATPDSCLSSVPLSGAEAVEWIRITLQVLGRS